MRGAARKGGPYRDNAGNRPIFVSSAIPAFLHSFRIFFVFRRFEGGSPIAGKLVGEVEGVKFPFQLIALQISMAGFGQRLKQSLARKGLRDEVSDMTGSDSGFSSEAMGPMRISLRLGRME